MGSETLKANNTITVPLQHNCHTIRLLISVLGERTLLLVNYEILNHFYVFFRKTVTSLMRFQLLTSHLKENQWYKPYSGLNFSVV